MNNEQQQHHHHHHHQTTNGTNKPDDEYDSGNQGLEEESNDHLPRVQVELDKLNYANESINNLELELEESKKEFIRTWHESDEELTKLEKKLGTCVSKSLPYYESRIELSDAKEKYLKAKIQFETAQELYMAAKNMQMYAEETLEKAEAIRPINRDTDCDEIVLLKLAKSKVNETEQAKKTSDTELVEALGHYEEKRDKLNACEKDLKKFIEKSFKYFELKSRQLKELRFIFTKIEALKSCLKEAKSTYQQSLKNLESISTEIHVQRKTSSLNKSSISRASSLKNKPTQELESDSNNNTCTNHNLESPSSSTLSSSSSSSLIISETSNHPLADLLIQETQTTTKSNENENASVKTIFHQKSGSVASEEDYDLYFLNNKNNEDKQENPTVTSTTPSQPPPTPQNTPVLVSTSAAPLLSRNSVIRKSSSNSNWISNWTNSNTYVSDEDVDNLKLDEKLKNYKKELENSYRNKGGTKTEIILIQEQNVLQQTKIISQKQQEQPLSAEILLTNSSNDGDSANLNTRPQFRVPSFFNNINRK